MKRTKWCWIKRTQNGLNAPAGGGILHNTRCMILFVEVLLQWPLETREICYFKKKGELEKELYLFYDPSRYWRTLQFKSCIIYLNFWRTDCKRKNKGSAYENQCYFFCLPWSLTRVIWKVYHFRIGWNGVNLDKTKLPATFVWCLNPLLGVSTTALRCPVESFPTHTCSSVECCNPGLVICQKCFDVKSSIWVWIHDECECRQFTIQVYLLKKHIRELNRSSIFGECLIPNLMPSQQKHSLALALTPLIYSNMDVNTFIHMKNDKEHSPYFQVIKLLFWKYISYKMSVKAVNKNYILKKTSRITLP
jgi:hypothetical protein